MVWSANLEEFKPEILAAEYWKQAGNEAIVFNLFLFGLFCFFSSNLRIQAELYSVLTLYAML